MVGERRWQKQQMRREVLADLLDYKLPALAQTGVDVTSATIVLFSRSGFRKELKEQASLRGNIELVELPRLLGEGREGREVGTSH